MNWLTEMNWGWWPVLSLRPPKEGHITDRIILRLSMLFGASFPVVVLLLVSLWDHKPVSIFPLVTFPILGFIVFFILYKFSFAYFWNRRANRLQSSLRP